MNKLVFTPQATVFCGIDVSARSLAVSQIGSDGSLAQREFANSGGGHKALLAWLARCNTKVRVSLVVDQAELKNRLRTSESTAPTPRAVLVDLRQALAALERRVAKMRREALELVRAEAALWERFRLLTSVPGIAEIGALQILSELVLLAPTVTVRQWVASSGLDPGSPRTGLRPWGGEPGSPRTGLRPWGGDPAHRQSGTSLHKPSRISRAGNRHLRRALYMPALSAARNDPHLRAFYQALRSRHKTGLQALMAVARKLLHAIYGIFKSGRPYDGKLLFPNIQTEVESIAG